MIQQEYKNTITDQSGDITTTGFTVEANASVYAMLTQNVYNDPILAVMREYSTNACDACLAAGKPVKYDVHLPTITEPEFFVRDYGTGLSAEDIIGLFSTLGASTKRESNLYNGALGIGRMAGLAAADAFTIESYYKGTRMAYVVSMKEGIPVTLHLADHPTDEPDGLKLSIAVANEDIEYYREKAGDLYKYFDYKPNLNDPTIQMDLTVEEQLSDDWFILPRTTSYDYDNYLVMAQVRYRIPKDPAIKTHDFRQLVIKAPTGAVTFNPGRESLSLDKKTIEYLNNAFTRIKEEYVTKATIALAACANDAELQKIYHNITNNAPRALIQNLDPVKFMSPELQNLVVNNYSGSYIIRADKDFENATAGTLTITAKRSYYKISKVLDARHAVAWATFFTTTHIIVDVKTKYKDALNQAYNDEEVIIWQRKQGVDLDTAVTNAKQYLKQLGLSYKLASDIIAEVPTVEKLIETREGLYVSPINHRQNLIRKSKKMPSEDVEKETYLYVKLKNLTPDLTDTTVTFDEYLALYSMMCNTIELPKIYGVSKKYQGFVDNLDNWVDFEEYIKRKIKNFRIKHFEEDLNTYFNRSHIDETNSIFYPELVRQYFKNAQAALEYQKAPNHVPETCNKELAVKFGAIVESFAPPYTVTKEEIQRKFKFTYDALFGCTYKFSSFSSKEIRELAELEENYAIHSIKQ